MVTTKHIDKSVNGKSVNTKFTGEKDVELAKSSVDSDRLPGLSAAPSGQIPHPDPSKKPDKLEESE